MFGAGMFDPALSGVALGTLPEEHSGLAAGVNDMFRQAGIAVGVAALGALIRPTPSMSGDKQGYVDSLHTALAVRARSPPRSARGRRRTADRPAGPGSRPGPQRRAGSRLRAHQGVTLVARAMRRTSPFSSPRFR